MFIEAGCMQGKQASPLLLPFCYVYNHQCHLNHLTLSKKLLKV